MRDVYGASFTLVGGGFESVRDRVLAWSLERFNVEVAPERIDGRVESPDGSWAEWSTFASTSSDDQIWVSTFRHRDTTDASLAWQASAFVADENGELRFTLRLGQDSLDPLLRPTAEAVGRPRIVRDLIREFGAEADGTPLSPEARLVPSDGVAALARLLTDSKRTLPVVALTVAEDTGRPITDPNRVASELVGIAHTIVIATVPASYELTDAVGRRLSAFGGAVRIYWPGFSLESDPYAHRLYLGRTVEGIDSRTMRGSRPAGFANELVRLLGDVAALRVQPDPLFRVLRREVEASRRAAERQTSMELLARERDHIPDEFALEFDRQGERIQSLEFELDLRDEEIEGLRRDLRLIGQSFSEVKGAMARDGGGVATVASAGLAEPKSIEEAAHRLAETYADAVVVLDQAYESAQDTRYPQIDRATKALQAVGEVAAAWRDDALGMSFESAFQERGFDLRTVGAVTQGRWRSDYERMHDGERLLIGPHIALGDGGSTDTIFRVYWCVDERERRFIVGHIGRHLRDSST